MKRIFLGPFIHWLVLIVVVAGGWFAGDARLHVRQFDLFLILLIVATVVGLIIVLVTTRPGMQVTRDPIEDIDDPDDIPPISEHRTS